MNKELENNQTISHYRIVSRIGKGGMGEVYLAEDTKLNRQVALKILPAEFAIDTDRMSRFVREAKSASALNHPNIITIYEIGEIDGTHFIATEFIDGETLNDYARSNPLDYKSILEIAVQVASALQTAHVAGIVHRDIKPENVMIRPDGLVKILDFGIAKLTEKQTESIDAEAATVIKSGTSPGMIIGTASYMSPEQATGKAVDARSDIFSFGCVLYEMIAGRQPFEGENALDVIGSILNKEPKPLSQSAPDVPHEIERIVNKALRKDRDQRYQTAKDLLIDLEDAKEELKFQSKLERTAPPNREETKTQTFKATTDSAQTTSSAEYVVNEIKNHKLGFFTLSVLLLAAIGLGYWFFFNHSSNVKQIESIAVLPFVNGSNDANLDYLSDGLSESVIDRLSQLPQLKVIARSSSFKYRGENIDLQDAANKLGVQAIVMGKVVQRGDNLSIRVEMIDASNNKQLWGEQYNRKVTDALTIQQEIAQTVSEKLRLKLSGEQEQQLAKQQTTNPQAYELLLKGIFDLEKGGTENQKKALEYFQQAVAVDPNYATAYALLSASYSGLVGNSVLDPKEYTPKAEAAARKALELNENLSEAHLAMANIYKNNWDWATAEQEYKRSIELNSNFGVAHRSYSSYLDVVGRYDEAIAEAKRARELDPLTLSTNATIAYRLYHARRYDEAIEVVRKTLEIDPNYIFAHTVLGYTYVAKGMYREAIAAYREAIRLGDNSPSGQIYLGAAYARAGEREKAQAILRQLETSQEYVSPGELPALYIALGEREKAFTSFEKAFAAHDLQMQYLKIDPAFDPLRDDPRFQDLLRRVGFTQ